MLRFLCYTQESSMLLQSHIERIVPALIKTGNSINALKGLCMTAGAQWTGYR